MSVRVTRKMGHPRRPREFGRDLPCSGNTGEEVWQGGREAGGGVKQNVRESVLGLVRRVEEGMWCYQVRQDSAEGERSTGSVHKMPHWFVDI